MFIIDNQRALNEFCRQIQKCKTISVDTEFVRKNTYYAKLSIIQVMADAHKVIIDTLSNIDLSPLNEVFLNNEVIKIFHAPREDFEIFYHLFKTLPKNIFDTQIAAQFCEFGKYLSYGDVCHKICGIEIDKTYQRSNWLKRPMSNDMLEYAIKDVEYLEEIYEVLWQIITTSNIQNEYNQQVKSSLLNVENYTVNASKAWTKVKFNNHSNSFTRKMQIIAAYREEQASTINLPRRHFITDEDLVKICQYLPTTNRDFEQLKLVDGYLGRQKYRNQVAEICLAIQGIKHQL